MGKNRGNVDENNIYFNRRYNTSRRDLARIIAQETSGFVGAMPEGDDYELADKFIQTINSDDTGYRVAGYLIVHSNMRPFVRVLNKEEVDYINKSLHERIVQAQKNETENSEEE